MHLGAGQHDGQALRPLCAHQVHQPANAHAEHLAIQKEQRGEGLVLRGRAHTLLDREAGKKPREVLGVRVGWLVNLVRAKRPERLPVVLTRAEVHAVLARLRGPVRLVAALLYGAGLRLFEALQLRAKDLDFGAAEILVRGGKGDRDRLTLLPVAVRAPLGRQLALVRALHERDVAAGAGSVELPDAVARKYPAAGREWRWQWVFPAGRM